MPNKSNTNTAHPNMAQMLATGICAKRKAKKMSQYDLSDSTGLTRNCIQQMECQEHLPKLETVFEIMLGLDFNEEESKDFLWSCLNAYRKDKELQNEQEKGSAGVI